ncbi:uncharacterized protein AKAW2_30265A [Aspergillus luchuensis]|uniref:Uncharacterized protein n=1 Tax=Aspergillus kawachii TaxID=1069201 RepID=A0A7R7W617_ASPKA|nr:uncharacterized protein AKAW2_30265A [Aspergillus luchuensis]BCR96946.1 hypothetical protein AKAW2_30265A [Aspergillus luchuensis]BCS09427.1 hypothetical protein ALUC_30244A [Aspergillus luchuensis]
MRILLISLEGTDHTSWLGYCITNLETRGSGPTRATSTKQFEQATRLDIVLGFLPEEALLPVCNYVFHFSGKSPDLIDTIGSDQNFWLSVLFFRYDIPGCLVSAGRSDDMPCLFS